MKVKKVFHTDYRVRTDAQVIEQMQSARIKQQEDVKTVKALQAQDEYLQLAFTKTGDIVELSKTSEAKTRRRWVENMSPQRREEYLEYRRLWARKWRLEHPEQYRAAKLRQGENKKAQKGEALRRGRPRKSLDELSSSSRGHKKTPEEREQILQDVKEAARLKADPIYNGAFEELLPGHCRVCAVIVSKWYVGKRCDNCK